MRGSWQTAFGFFVVEATSCSVPPPNLDDSLLPIVKELPVQCPDFLICLFVSLLCYILLPLNLFTWIFSYHNLEMITSLFSCWIISYIVSGSFFISLITFIWRVAFKPESRDARLHLVNVLLAEASSSEVCVHKSKRFGVCPVLVYRFLKGAVLLYHFVELPNTFPLALIGRLSTNL